MTAAVEPRTVDKDFRFSYADACHNWFERKAIRFIELVTGQPELKRLYEAYVAEGHPDSAFFSEALARLRMTVNVTRESLTRIPKEGPLVIVANHPFGVLDGLIIGRLAQETCLNFRVLTHSALCAVPEMTDYLLPVDFSETAQALQTNLKTRSESRRILAEGGCIVVFPGGTVSTARHVFDFERPLDPDWQPFTSHLIRKARATVLPIHFDGQNGRLFQTVSQFSTALRQSLLFHEVHKKIGGTVDVVIGDPIPFDELEQFNSRAELATHLRSLTYALPEKFS
ncbi:MAG: acyltransferase [Alphaproteobacteria bacterium]|nr:MAG: acyltransferase [Alphaproteobacteria bacterium]